MEMGLLFAVVIAALGAGVGLGHWPAEGTGQRCHGDKPLPPSFLGV